MTFIVRVWDAPTRLFHWALVLCVTGLVISGSMGGAAMSLHFLLGYCTATLLLFRLIWGVIGGYWSRFSSFLYGHQHLVRFLAGQGPASDHIGHNPLGALSVFAMLALLGVQVVSGLLSDDEIAAAGPLAAHMSGLWVNYATYYHKQVGKPVLLSLIVMHIGAIAFHFFVKRDNLITPMLTGDKTLRSDGQKSIDSALKRWIALVVVLLSSALIYGMISMLEG
jgi:cytochrome b